MERVLLVVGRNFPADGEVRDDRLAVAGIAAEEAIVHGSLAADVGHGPGLVQVEVDRGAEDAVPERPAVLGRGIDLDRRILRQGLAWRRQPRGHERARAAGAHALQERSAIDAGRTSGTTRITHRFLLWEQGHGRSTRAPRPHALP